MLDSSSLCILTLGWEMPFPRVRYMGDALRAICAVNTWSETAGAPGPELVLPRRITERVSSICIEGWLEINTTSSYFPSSSDEHTLRLSVWQ